MHHQIGRTVQVESEQQPFQKAFNDSFNRQHESKPRHAVHTDLTVANAPQQPSKLLNKLKYDITDDGEVRVKITDADGHTVKYIPPEDIRETLSTRKGNFFDQKV